MHLFSTNTYNHITGFKSIVLVRKEDAVEDMRKEGADEVIVTGKFKTATDHTNAILKVTDGPWILKSYNLSKIYFKFILDTLCTSLCFL